MKLGETKVAGIDSLPFDKPTGIAISNDGSFCCHGLGRPSIFKGDYYSAEFINLLL